MPVKYSVSNSTTAQNTRLNKEKGWSAGEVGGEVATAGRGLGEGVSCVKEIWKGRFWGPIAACILFLGFSRPVFSKLSAESVLHGATEVKIGCLLEVDHGCQGLYTPITCSTVFSLSFLLV